MNNKKSKTSKWCMAFTALTLGFTMPAYAAETQPPAAISDSVSANDVESEGSVDSYVISADNIHFDIPEQVDNVHEFYVTGYVEDYVFSPGAHVLVVATNKATGFEDGLWLYTGDYTTYIVNNQFTHGPLNIADYWDEGEYTVKVYILAHDYTTLGISYEQDFTYIKAK